MPACRVCKNTLQCITCTLSQCVAMSRTHTAAAAAAVGCALSSTSNHNRSTSTSCSSGCNLVVICKLLMQSTLTVHNFTITVMAVLDRQIPAQQRTPQGTAKQHRWQDSHCPAICRLQQLKGSKTSALVAVPLTLLNLADSVQDCARVSLKQPLPV